MRHQAQEPLTIHRQGRLLSLSRGARPNLPEQRKELPMDLEHALTLAQARSFVAALADAAVDDDASAAFELVLIELDWLHGDESPGLETHGLNEDRKVLYLAAAAAIEALALFGLDALDLELLLVRLEAARALDRL
jgi:hypothetical protein